MLRKLDFIGEVVRNKNSLMTYYDDIITKNRIMAKLSAFRMMELHIVRVFVKNRILVDGLLESEYFNESANKKIQLKKIICIVIHLSNDKYLDKAMKFSRLFSHDYSHGVEDLCKKIIKQFATRDYYSNSINIDDLWINLEKFAYNITVNELSDEQKYFLMKIVKAKKNLEKATSDYDKSKEICKNINDEFVEKSTIYRDMDNKIRKEINERKQIKNKEKKIRNKYKKALRVDNFPILCG